MKDSLHFILFGVFAVLGLGMFTGGVLMKMGAQSSLQEAAAKVSAADKKNPPTKGDVTFLQGEQAKFNKAVESLEKSFTTDEGGKLMLRQKQFKDPNDFFTQMASIELASLKSRFKAMENPPKVTERLEKAGKKFGQSMEENNFWDQTTAEFKAVQPNDIELFQARLKVMQEVCVVCEKLRASAEFKQAMFVFTKFDFSTFNTEPTRDKVEPWLRREFGFFFDADPSLAVAIMSHLLAPSELTQSSSAAKREGVPFELVSLQGTQPGRPLYATYEVKADERKAHDIPDDWKADVDLKAEEVASNPMDKDKPSKRSEIARKLEEEIRQGLPMTFELKLAALSANMEWFPVYKAPEETTGG